MCLVGCDKTVPAALMALARVDKPAVVLYSGPMRAGRFKDREVSIQDIWESLGAYERGGSPRGAGRDGARGVPRPGHLRGEVHRQHDGARARVPRGHTVRDQMVAADELEQREAQVRETPGPSRLRPRRGRPARDSSTAAGC